MCNAHCALCMGIIKKHYIKINVIKNYDMHIDYLKIKNKINICFKLLVVGIINLQLTINTVYIIYLYL